MRDYALILHPADPLVSIAVADLEAGLSALGLLGKRLPHAPSSDWYESGPHLLELVTFLGCSPVVRVAASSADDNGFCRLRLPPPLPHPTWRASLDAAPPRCPRCRAPDANWCLQLPAWQADPAKSRALCPACGHAAPLHQWRLREAFGYGQSFVECWGIHPGEAVPGEALLDTLAALSGSPWLRFYCAELRPTL